MSRDLPRNLRGSRVIVHIDLDCFYCQVEQVRRGVPTHVPAAVQQWQGLIAVNYAARAAGVTRHANIEDARKACPEIQLLHVATYAENETEWKYHARPSRATHKVSLDPYREASKKIFTIFKRHCDTVQKIGLDECFMDLTETVNELMTKRYPTAALAADDDLCDQPIDWNKLGVTIASEDESERRRQLDNDVDADHEEESWRDPATWQDLQLAIGAELAAAIRQEIYDELSYTCSAGIAHNKVVAKLCSSKNKPNKQTILRHCATAAFMRDTPFTKIRNLGGKLGTEVETELNIDKAGDLWKYTVNDLQQRFGESTGLWLYNVARGIDNEEVTVTKAPKSIMASKSFRPPVKSSEEMQRWFATLAAELHTRMMLNFDEFDAWPKTLTIHYRSTQDTTYRTRSCAMPRRTDLTSPDKLAQRAIILFGKAEDALPCVGLSLNAVAMQSSQTVGNHSISEFFKQGAKEVARMSGETPPRSASPSPQSSMHDNGESGNSRSQKSAGILAYLNAPQSSNSTHSSDPNKWMCDKCHKNIPINKVDEHTDYHFALDLQAEDRGSASPSTSPSTKRKSEDPPATVQKSSKYLFFQRRSQ
ncbi:hypothetical protein BCR43DRAFT_563787 [Syncephalastrum racemosum]|uniref:DNA polymerase eta n=1 Tax=Syncephalastrum racemosum TaxID=13706 RepID=A0A1X2HCH0_SYNRA|nr:hypothetical protein BCR43DRAFT_563787 [Syncephalastrum racemosum]